MTVTEVREEIVTDPTELGIVPERLDALLTRIRREIDAGALPSCQLAVAKDGRLVAFTTLGDATNDTRYVIYSATKPIISMAALLLVQDGSLDLNTKVADLIPEFSTNGKDVVTVEQVMLHLGGFPTAPMGPPVWFERELRLKKFESWRLNFEPGTRYVYHSTSAHWVLAELIERLSGLDHRRFVAERVAAPLGLEGLKVGLDPEEQQTSAEQILCGEEATEDELEAAIGIRRMPRTEVTDDALMNFNDTRSRALGVPGGGGVMTAATLALFYQHLLHDPNRVWDPEVLDDAKTNVRNRVPDFMGNPATRTLVFITAGDDGRSHARGMGRTVSPGTFGHNGAAGQLAWADPETGISLAYLTNGIERHYLKLHRRGTAISSLAGDLLRQMP